MRHDSLIVVGGVQAREAREARNAVHGVFVAGPFNKLAYKKVAEW